MTSQETGNRRPASQQVAKLRKGVRSYWRMLLADIEANRHPNTCVKTINFLRELNSEFGADAVRAERKRQRA